MMTYGHSQNGLILVVSYVCIMLVRALEMKPDFYAHTFLNCTHITDLVLQNPKCETIYTLPYIDPPDYREFRVRAVKGLLYLYSA
jgi:hypothetical protein